MTLISTAFVIHTCSYNLLVPEYEKYFFCLILHHQLEFAVIWCGSTCTLLPSVPQNSALQYVSIVLSKVNSFFCPSIYVTYLTNVNLFFCTYYIFIFLHLLKYVPSYPTTGYLIVTKFSVFEAFRNFVYYGNSPF